ncbi:MAG: DUF4070 domain-containing protein [Bacteroidales bacterium]|nr:DUF4070 domain-containing protein [Bacteroidales bacterium]
MNILLVSPQYPDSFWSFSHALKFISKKAAVPPLGLITVSAMLPKTWNKKLVDMNVNKLHIKDIEWADYVFISAMYIQKESVDKVLNLCKKHSTKVVAGGPLFTQEYNNYPLISHFILNESEITMPQFLADLENNTLQRVYKTEEFADLNLTPTPDYHLLNRKEYAFMNIQVSRGCPFSCDFCEITSLFGHKVRMKHTSQIINELDTLYNLKWKGSIFIVDDNFIGNKKQIKTDLLPAMKTWMEAHKYPFTFNTQTSINLADDKELMQMMIDAGFNSTFIGIETPAEESLHSCNKKQNENRDLLHSVKTIQSAGLQVSAGFIVGFDSDSETVFQRQIDFIQQSGIVSAMVGLLNAPKNTKLYQQMEEQNRLTVEATGSNTDMSMNFIPKMDAVELVDGYKTIITNIYSAKPYYQRIKQFLYNYNQKQLQPKKLVYSDIRAFVRAIIVIGILNKGRREYWKLFFWTIFNKPHLFTDAMTFAVYGYHFRIVYGLVEKRNSRQYRNSQN